MRHFYLFLALLALIGALVPVVTSNNAPLLKLDLAIESIMSHDFIVQLEMKGLSMNMSTLLIEESIVFSSSKYKSTTVVLCTTLPAEAVDVKAIIYPSEEELAVSLYPGHDNIHIRVYSKRATRTANIQHFANSNFTLLLKYRLINQFHEIKHNVFTPSSIFQLRMLRPNLGKTTLFNFQIRMPWVDGKYNSFCNNRWGSLFSDTGHALDDHSCAIAHMQVCLSAAFYPTHSHIFTFFSFFVRLH